MDKCTYAVTDAKGGRLCGQPATHHTAQLPVYPQRLPLCGDHAQTYPPGQVEPIKKGATR